jgi:hypothetical protein
MSKPSITIGISVYDRINDSKVAALLAKTVLAAYFEVKVVVAACKPDTKRELENIEYIDFVLEPNIPKETPLEFNIHSNLGAARTFSSFLKCGNYAQKNQTDYYCFGNAGSWLLGPDGIIELTSKLNKGNKLAACRVAREGRKYLVEDHFFLVNLKISKDQQIFNGKFYDRFFNPIFFYDNGIHSLLENWINLKTEPGQVIIYSDLTDCKNHFGDPVNSFVPFSLDLKKNFIHSNPLDLPDEILTLRIKYIETCEMLNEYQKTNLINLLNKETSGKLVRSQVKKIGSMYYIGNNMKKGLFYVVIRSKIIWLLLSELSRILTYLGLKFPIIHYFGKKMEKIISRYRDSYKKINFEKIQ